MFIGTAIPLSLLHDPEMVARLLTHLISFRFDMSLVASLRSPVRIAPCMARLMSGERFGHSNGDSGWRSSRLRVNVEHSFACMKTHTLEQVGQERGWHGREGSWPWH